MAHDKAIPAAIMGVVRTIAILELGGAATDIEQVCIGGADDGEPEGFAEELQRFDSLRALVEAIGWRNVERVIDLREHGALLTEVLEARLELDRYFINDPSTSPASRARTERDIAGVEEFLRAAGLKGGER